MQWGLQIHYCISEYLPIMSTHHSMRALILDTKDSSNTAEVSYLIVRYLHIYEPSDRMDSMEVLLISGRSQMSNDTIGYLDVIPLAPGLHNNC